MAVAPLLGQAVRLPEEMTYWPVGDVIPYERNSRTHTPEQIASLAGMILEFGFTNPILIDANGGIIAGHGRLEAAKSLGMERVPVIQLGHLTAQQRRALVIADNRIAEKAGWNDAMLAAELADLSDEGFDLSLTGFSDDEVERLFAELGEPPPRSGTGSTSNTTGAGDLDDLPPPAPIVSRRGDVWLLGPHRVMCGDSRSGDDVEHLVGERRAVLLHADPPYGMGKSAEGVLNDNLYGAKLDAFQMAWWSAFRPYLASNGSAYVWGNAPDLWRLWWRHLEASEPMTMGNEIVWDKRSIAGMASPDMIAFPEASERCLFFQMGVMPIVNRTAADFWPGFAPLQVWAAEQAKLAGFTPKMVREITGKSMFQHWFSRSQWAPIDQANYEKLATAARGAGFTRPWEDFNAEYRTAAAIFRGEIMPPEGSGLSSRSYFDNAHDAMTDVWAFPRVNGPERFDHATPKPVAMMERVILSSSRPGDFMAEPFGGTGSTLIAAEVTGRICACMELKPVYVDTIVRRWQAVTGQEAVHEDGGQSFDQVATARGATNDATA